MAASFGHLLLVIAAFQCWHSSAYVVHNRLHAKAPALTQPWSWYTRFGPGSSSNAAPIGAVNLSSVPQTVQAVNPRIRSCRECDREPVVPNAAIGLDFDSDGWYSAQTVGAHAAYLFFTYSGGESGFFGSLVTVSLGPLGACDESSSLPAAGGPGNATPACLPAPPFGTVLAWSDVPQPPRCRGRSNDDDIVDDDDAACRSVNASPDLILASIPSRLGTGNLLSEQQAAITVSITGDALTSASYIITAFNVSVPYSGYIDGPTNIAVLWSTEALVPPFPDGPPAFVRLMQVGSDTLAVIIAGCVSIYVDLYNVTTGNMTGSGQLQMSSISPPDCGADLTTNMAVAGTMDGYVAATITPNGFGLQQNVVVGQLATTSNGTLTVNTLWSNNAQVCGGAPE